MEVLEGPKPPKHEFEYTCTQCRRHFKVGLDDIIYSVEEVWKTDGDPWGSNSSSRQKRDKFAFVCPCGLEIRTRPPQEAADWLRYQRKVEAGEAK